MPQAEAQIGTMRLTPHGVEVWTDQGWVCLMSKDTQPLDRDRLHRFLQEHRTAPDGQGAWFCVGCGALYTHGVAPDWKAQIDHQPDCEWLALIEMTRPI